MDRRARWGIVLQATGYWLLWQTRFWERPTDSWRMLVSVCFFASRVFCRGAVHGRSVAVAGDAGLNTATSS